jgi:arylsulfatase A-like enzyme
MGTNVARKATVIRWTLAAIVVLVAAGVVVFRSRPSPPNIILISIDSLRPDHLGCYGYARNTSPNLDKLAREGALFETVVSTTSWTLPAHAALFTALADSVHFCYDDTKWLDGSRTTLAEKLKDAGYKTHGFYSAPYLNPCFGFAQGFDRYQDCTSYSGQSVALLQTDRFIKDQSGEHGLIDQEIMHEAHLDITNPIVLAEVEKWLEERSDGPFFLFIHLWDVHYDYIAPQEYQDMFTSKTYQGPVDGKKVLAARRKPENWTDADVEHLKALYDAEIRYTDDTIGKILENLEDRGLKDTSIIAVTADHGEAFYEHGWQGHRWTLHDEEIRIPLIVRYPLLVPEKLRIDRPVSIIDIAPTLLDLAASPPLPHAMGRSLTPLFGERQEGWRDETAICELKVPANNIDSLALRDRDGKIIYDEKNKKVLVYDLAKDPGEQEPLQTVADSVEAIVAQREATLKTLAEKKRRLGTIGERDTPAISEMTIQQLRANGYLGTGQTSTPSGLRKRNAKAIDSTK